MGLQIPFSQCHPPPGTPRVGLCLWLGGEGNPDGSQS